MELISGLLKVQAIRIGDRYAFAMFAKCDAIWSQISDSVNAISGFAYPPSPPIQQAVLEELAPGRTAILGVGMAGDGHWSLSIEANESEGLDFDIACRLKSPMPWLGSTWRIRSPWHISVEQEAGSKPSSVAILADGEPKLRLHAEPPAVIQCADDSLSVSPPLHRSEAPSTIRWQFSLRKD